ncbi:hypothetical protein T4C_7034 [Trichinella pseudospiralis]|uniref:Uncharacterized protein n=1 Tax=Trichinella pseudospiralis TaxID=6337 RepID=A0A0V1K9V5_TRIPS|nr:hypothetical protein T4C_7034 [Trichinella pseudospiralis]
MDALKSKYNKSQFCQIAAIEHRVTEFDIIHDEKGFLLCSPLLNLFIGQLRMDIKNGGRSKEK